MDKQEAKCLLPASACRRQEMGTFGTPGNLLSSGRNLTSFAACNLRKLVFVCITLCRKVGSAS